MRRAARIDANHVRIAEALRDVGAIVESLAAVGDGVPDLLVGYRSETHLLEVKDGAKTPSKRRLTPEQRTWHERWRGRPVAVVLNETEALRAIGAIE